MVTPAIEKLASGLLAGELPEATAREYSDAVQWIADALIQPGRGVLLHQVRGAVNALNSRGRLYEQTIRLGNAWTACRGFDAVLARHHAQALINLSALDAAEVLLEQGLACATQPGADDDTEAEASEYRGLLARVSKQRFIMTGDKAQLRKATRQYLDQRNSAAAGDSFWHGINAVALLKYQQRNGMLARSDASADALAGQICDEVTRLQVSRPTDPWLAATLSEAYLALGTLDLAELWMYRFLNHPKATPFCVDSYDRQLREIWQGCLAGGGNPPADRLVAIVARHLMRHQSRMSMSATGVHEMADRVRRSPEVFERNFSGEHSFSLDALKGMLAACDSIGCVSNHVGERLGTGFLVAGEELNPAFGPSPVFVTNAHVLGPDVPKAIRPHEARVTFETDAEAGGATAYKVAELLFTSGPGGLGMACAAQDHLDVTIVRLRGLAPHRAVLRLADRLPSINARSRAYVVGHPLGAALQFSLNDSVLLDIDDAERLVHYRTPTDPGSSGSPVFSRSASPDSYWDVIALHHAGSAATPRLHGNGTYEANEGIALEAIRRCLSAR